jgi:two-component system cell cycle response regulator
MICRKRRMLLFGCSYGSVGTRVVWPRGWAVYQDEILIAITDQALFKAVKGALDGHYPLLDARQGFETVRLAKSGKPALVILDIEISGLNGIDCCRRLKADAETKDIPVILIHSRTNTEDVIFGLQAGADDYLTKPINPTDVLARVDSHLNYNRFLEGLEYQDLRLLLELTNAISSLRNPNKILNIVVKNVAEIIGVERCSIVSMGEKNQLTIKASNDLTVQDEIKVDLDGYPEIRKAFETRKAVIVNDTTSDPLMEPVREQIKKRGLNAIFVIPIIKKESVIGSLFLGTATSLPEGISDRASKLCHLVANICANALENAILFESMATAKEVFEEYVTRDGLTRLYTHRHFYSQLEKEFSRTTRYNFPLSLIFLNIDDFRKVNDTYGHMVGDEVLKQIGRFIRSILRDVDVPARYSGDEFAVLLPSTDKKGALHVARRLITLVRGYEFAGMASGHLTISAGIATYSGRSPKNFEQLVQAAVMAMKRAKAGGKMRVVAGEEL